MNGIWGILADAHGHGPALEKGVRILRSFGAKHFFFLGDCVGYIPSLSALDYLIDLGSSVKCVRGNHEKMLLEGIDYQRDAIYKLHAFKSMLETRHLEYILSWHSRIAIRNDFMDFSFMHGGPIDNVSQYIFADTDLSKQHFSHSINFIANTHRPFIREHEGKRIINVGSCGLPRDDGRFGSAVLFDSETKSSRILRFNIESETKHLLKLTSNVHESVIDLFKRKSSEMVGEIVC